MNTLIDVQHISKTFNVQYKKPGFLASIRALYAPEYKEVKAVDDISFKVDQGEALAFIGPNGAGKSTAIKMLTGIIHPTSGSIRILGYDPARDRQKMAYHIGCVFGQKAQLSYHLPPLDSFYVLSRIYELKPHDFQERLSFLVKAFDIGSVMHIPVRKLSLGQRMRCEIAASLLHRPQIVFLDEPTIGLDVIAKQQVRDVLTFLNQQEGVTLFLTSHDAGDIETITQRTIVVNHGTIIFDDETNMLKKQYLTTKIIELFFEESAESFNFEQGKLVERNAHSVKVEIDTSPYTIEKLLAYTFEHFTVVDINMHETSLEDIIAALYRKKRA